jgi:uncharacterized protein with FMN-binding domain
MKKILLSAAVIIVIGGYAFWRFTTASTDVLATTTPPTTTTSVPSETTNPAAGSGSGTGSTGSTGGSTTTTGQYKDGTYTGKVADAFYGNLQVKATIAGGKLTNVAFLQYPKDRGESVQVNSHSNPILITEAIAAQSANVDTVSGATQSSQAFQISLGDALTQAQS